MAHAIATLSVYICTTILQPPDHQRVVFRLRLIAREHDCYGGARQARAHHEDDAGRCRLAVAGGTELRWLCFVAISRTDHCSSADVFSLSSS